MDLSRDSLRYLARRGHLSARRWLSATLIEKRLGIETSEPADLADFGLHAGERVRYEPSSWLSLRRALAPEAVANTDVFVDLGSGKGRIVLSAARHYPFARVIGVEIAAELTAVASANVEASRSRLRCRNIELVTADALEWEMPGDVTILFLYNPLRGEMFAAFAAHLVAELGRTPRPFRLIYNTPVEHDRLMATGCFEVLGEKAGLRPTKAWSKKLCIRTYGFVPALAAIVPPAAS
jgi:SAM-dependent methyltransferase